MTCANVTELHVLDFFGELKLDFQSVCGKQAAIILSRHFQHIAGIEQRNGVLLQRLFAPFVLSRVGEEVKRNLVAALIVVADESPNEHVTAQTVAQLADFHLVVVFISPFQTVDLHLVVEMASAKRGEETHQLNGRQIILLRPDALVFLAIFADHGRQ